MKPIVRKVSLFAVGLAAAASVTAMAAPANAAPAPASTAPAHSSEAAGQWWVDHVYYYKHEGGSQAAWDHCGRDKRILQQEYSRTRCWPGTGSAGLRVELQYFA